MKELTEQEALCKAAAYCSSCEHCTAEVIAKLTAWNISAEAQERILKRLTKERYIDETRYARFFVNDKFRFNKWGRHRIAQELKMKHIPTSLIEEQLQTIDEEEYLDILRSLLATKAKSVKGKNEYERNGKLIRFAIGRGYEMECIRRCLPEADDEAFFMD